MGQQDNQPNNDSLQSMTKPDRTGQKGQENQAQEFINETDADTNKERGIPATAERGGQPRTSQLKNPNEMGRNS